MDGWGNLETKNEEKSQVPRKVMEQTILNAIMWHVQNQQGSGPAKRVSERQVLLDQPGFCDKVTCLVGE